MRYKAKLMIIAILMCLVSCGASRREPVNSVDTSQMQKMYTTAYCLHGITANGGTTRKGICACNTHLGDMAIIYSVNGDFLGMYEVTDTGSTDGLTQGRVIDVWFDTYEECEEWMRTTEGRCYVLWVKGVG